MPPVAAVTLRSIETTDAVRIQRYASDARLAETCGIPHPYPPDGGESFVQSCLADRDAGTHYPLAVLLDGELVGIMNLNRIDRDRGTAELDYWIAVPFWGRGIATAAARLAVTLAFAGLRLLVKVLATPKAFLMPTIALLCVIGSYALRNNFFDVYVMFFFGLLGLVMRWLDMPVVPLLLALVLGRPLEEHLRVSLISSQGDVSIFFTSPFSVFFLALAAISVFWSFYAGRASRGTRQPPGS